MFNRDFGIAGLRSAINRFIGFGTPRIRAGASLFPVPREFPVNSLLSGAKACFCIANIGVWRIASSHPQKFPADSLLYGNFSVAEEFRHAQTAPGRPR
jgi:hypothetical protein